MLHFLHDSISASKFFKGLMRYFLLFMVTAMMCGLNKLLLLHLGTFTIFPDLLNHRYTSQECLFLSHTHRHHHHHHCCFRGEANSQLKLIRRLQEKGLRNGRFLNIRITMCVEKGVLDESFPVSLGLNQSNQTHHCSSLVP